MSNLCAQIALLLLAVLIIKAGIAEPMEVVGLLLATRRVQPAKRQR